MSAIDRVIEDLDEACGMLNLFLEANRTDNRIRLTALASNVHNFLAEPDAAPEAAAELASMRAVIDAAREFIGDIGDVEDFYNHEEYHVLGFQLKTLSARLQDYDKQKEGEK